MNAQRSLHEVQRLAQRHFQPWSELVEEVQHVEATGHGIWIGDHFMAYGDDTQGPWQEAGALAGSRR